MSPTPRSVGDHRALAVRCAVAADARVRALLADVAAELLGEPLGDPGPAAAPVVGLASTFLRQGLELVENPGRQGGWDQVDVPLLQGVGRTSMGVLEAVRAAKGELDSLAERLPTEQDRPAHPASLTAPLSRTVAP